MSPTYDKRLELTTTGNSIASCFSCDNANAMDVLCRKCAERSTALVTVEFIAFVGHGSTPSRNYGTDRYMFTGLVSAGRLSGGL